MRARIDNIDTSFQLQRHGISSSARKVFGSFAHPDNSLYILITLTAVQDRVTMKIWPLGFTDTLLKFEVVLTAQIFLRILSTDHFASIKAAMNRFVQWPIRKPQEMDKETELEAALPPKRRKKKLIKPGDVDHVNPITWPEKTFRITVHNHRHGQWDNVENISEWCHTDLGLLYP